jgi:hypothetical protein
MAKAGDVQARALLAKFLESRRIMLGLELPRRADPLWRRQRRLPSESPK